MDAQAIRAFVAQSRQVANTQLERWDAVDPTRLLEACAIIEQLLDSAVAHTAPEVVLDGVCLVGYRAHRSPYLPTFGRTDIELRFQAGSRQPADLQAIDGLRGQLLRIDIYKTQ